MRRGEMREERNERREERGQRRAERGERIDDRGERRRRGERIEHTEECESLLWIATAELWRVPRDATTTAAKCTLKV